MKSWCADTIEMKNDVLRAAVELKILFWNKSSILVSVLIRTFRKIIQHYSVYFG